MSHFVVCGFVLLRLFIFISFLITFFVIRLLCHLTCCHACVLCFASFLKVMLFINQTFFFHPGLLFSSFSVLMYFPFPFRPTSVFLNGSIHTLEPELLFVRS